MKRLFAILLLGMAVLAAPTAADPSVPSRGGETQWVAVPGGRLKTRVYSTPDLGARPVLVVVLHGDIPTPPPSYQFHFAQGVTEGFGAVTVMPPSVRERLGADLNLSNLVAAGILRPGYTDEAGEKSDGDMGMAIGDNLTPAVVDAVATTIAELKRRYAPRAVILVGHSGGATIMADVMGRHPGLADAALLVACGCDPMAWRAKERIKQPDPVWDQPIQIVEPLKVAATVAPGAKIRLVVGDKDEVTLPEYSHRYAELLRARGVDARVTVVPGLGHNILFTRAAIDALAALIVEYPQR